MSTYLCTSRSHLHTLHCQAANSLPHKDNCSRTQKYINLNFFPHGWFPLKKWILSPKQDISGILWGCQGCTERCVSKAIFVSLLPTEEAGQHDPNRSLYHNKCPWILCLWSTAYRVGFPRSMGIDKANRWDCKARDNYVSAGVGRVFGFLVVVEDNRDSFYLRHMVPRHTDWWFNLLLPLTSKMKPMLKCLNPAFFLMTSRGRLVAKRSLIV